MAEESSTRRLGRGLAALMGELDGNDLDSPKQAERNARTPNEGVMQVPIESIRASANNPRRSFLENELSELAASIREHGLVQPILVRPAHGEDLGGAIYEIVAGERRWRASQMARLHEIPVIVRDLEDRQALEIAIIENVQREDLNPVEEALGYKKLLDEYDYSQGDLAKIIGKSRSHVANTLRLLKLPPQVVQLVETGELSAGHARTLIGHEQAGELATRAVRDALSVRDMEALVKYDDSQKKISSDKSSAPKDLKSVDVIALEKSLETVLGLKIDLRPSKGEKGELRIAYRTLDQLDDICRRLQSN